MTDAALSHYVAEHAADPAVRLLARSAAALRADADFVRDPADVTAAAFLNQEAPAALAEDALERTLGRIDRLAELDRRAAQAGPGHAEIARLPSPVREAALAALKHDRWRFGGLGVRRLPLLAGPGSQAELMRIMPGHGAAEHDHAADELTLVLTGAYDDGHARYAAGDVSLARPGFAHTPTAEPGEVCYVLAVTYGPPKFQGLFGLLQRTLGFPWSPKAKASPE
jgi:putative transcriptional regulator